MNSIWDVYNFVLNRLNKDSSGRTISPEQFNLACKFADYEILKHLYGLPEKYAPGQPFSPMAWEVTQYITDSLSHLKVYMGGQGYGQLQVDRHGFAVIPSDYLHYSSLAWLDPENIDTDEGTEDEVRVAIEVVKDGDWDGRVSNVITKATFENPICRFQEGYMEFRPRLMGLVDFVYLRKPIPAVLGYTINETTTNIEYDESTSTQPDWPQNILNEFANCIYSWCAVNIKDQVNIQDAQLRKVQGF